MSNLTMIRPVLATVQYPGVYAGFRQNFGGEGFLKDPPHWDKRKAYTPGEVVTSNRDSTFFGSNSSGTSAQLRARATELNNPDPKLRIELTYRFDGRSTIYDGMNNIYVCVKANTNVSPDLELLARNDPNNPEYFRRTGEDFVEPTWAFVRKAFQHSFTDETPSNANGLRNRLILDMICEDAIDTVACIGITGTDISCNYLPNSSSNEVAYSQSVDLSSTVPAGNWGALLSQEPSYATNHIFRGLPNRAYPLVSNNFSRSNNGRGQLRIVINNQGGFAKLGQIVLGRALDIGVADASVLNIRGVDYSEIDFNDYGDVQRTVRPATNLQTLGVKIRRDEMAFINNTMNDFRGGRPAVFTVGDDPRYGTTLYGFREDFSIEPDTTTDDMAILNVDVQGLI